MKRTNSRLQIKASTIRVLHGSELSVVNGGAPTNSPTNCSGSLYCLVAQKDAEGNDHRR